MTVIVRIDVGGLVKPCGVTAKEKARLAHRPDGLEGRRVLIFDNGKLQPDYGKWTTMKDVIEKYLYEEKRVSECGRLFKDPLILDYEELLALADEVATKSYAGVIIGLCDKGVTQCCCFIASELERKGVPTVMICTEEGLKLAQVMVQGLAPGLPLCSVRQVVFADETYVTKQTTDILPEIVAGLTKSAGVQQQKVSDSTSRCDFSGLSSRQVTVVSEDSEVRIPPGLFADDVYEFLCEANLSDGLPVVPPTKPLVEAMLTGTDRERDDVIVDAVYPSGSAVTVGGLAVNAVMAGCLPIYFPIIITAFEAMAEPAYRLFQSTITAHPSSDAVIVSGPLAKKLRIQSGQGCLGPGFRANATIGRAISLSLLNIARAIPGSSDLAPMGSPANYSYCFAEDVDCSPWKPLHVEIQDSETTTVTVFKCEGPLNLVDSMSKTPEHLLEGFASACTSLVSNNAYAPSNLLLILNPQHAALIAEAGWTKDDVKHFVFENVRNPRSKLAGRGLKNIWPREFDNLDPVPIMCGAEDCLVVVAGGQGVQSMVSLPWGYSRAVTKSVVDRHGKPLQSE